MTDRTASKFDLRSAIDLVLEELESHQRNVWRDIWAGDCYRYDLHTTSDDLAKTIYTLIALRRTLN